MCSHIRTRLDSLSEMASLDAVSFPGLYSKYFNIIFKIIYIYILFSLSIYNSLSQCQAPSLIATVPCLCQLSTTPSDGLLHGTLGRVSIGHTASIRAAMEPIWIAELQVFHQILDLLWLAKENNSRLEVKPPNTFGTAKDSFGGFPKCVIGHLFPSPADCQADAKSDSFWGWTTAPVLLFRSETLKSQDLLKSAGLPACLIGSCCSCFCSWLVSACLFKHWYWYC